MSLVLALRLPPTPGRGLPSCQAMIVAGRHTCVRPTVMSGAGICSRTRYVLIVATFTPRYAATSDVVHHSIAGSGRSLTLPLSPTTPPRGHLLPVVPQSRACRIPGCRGAGERERRQGRREGVACPRGIDGHRAAGEVTAEHATHPGPPGVTTTAGTSSPPPRAASQITRGGRTDRLLDRGNRQLEGNQGSVCTLDDGHGSPHPVRRDRHLVRDVPHERRLAVRAHEAHAHWRRRALAHLHALDAYALASHRSHDIPPRPVSAGRCHAGTKPRQRHRLVERPTVRRRPNKVGLILEVPLR
jgi:hypothetical protein